jgi:cystathionine gamma-synthase/methionine-gamma-lyase
MTDLSNKAFPTRAVHAGERPPHPDYTPVATPIHPTVGYLYDSLDDLDAVFATTREGYVYPRYGSPTVAAFEAAMAELEAGESAYAFASGMGAIHAALLAAGVRAGTAVVAALDLYGATYTLLNRLFADLGAIVRFVLGDLARNYGAQLLVDNTFASPYLCNPLVYGADFVIHSATKFIGGHGDVMAGVVVTSSENRRTLYELNKLVGGVLGPFEAWLALRGTKTLPLRVRQQCANAARIADWLNQHPQVGHVNYPGLAGHPQRALAGRLFDERGCGGVLSFEISDADQAAVFRFMEALDLCLPATTLGDIYTLVLHPATSSHRSLSPEEREQVGISEGLVRLSAGIEEAADIIADLDQALAASL